VFGGISGRYVRVQLTIPNALSLAEVRVHSPNIAATSIGTNTATDGLTLTGTVSNPTVGANLRLLGPGNLNLNGIISGAGALNQTGTGTSSLGAANTYTGQTIITNGTLKLGASNVIPDGPSTGSVHIPGGTLDMNGFVDTVNTLSGNGTVDITGGGIASLIVGGTNEPMVFGGAFRSTNGDLNVVKTGTSSFTLTGNSDHIGSMQVQQGTVIAQGGSSLSDNAELYLFDVAGVSLTLLASETIGSLHSGGTTGGNVNLGSFNLTVGSNNHNSTYNGNISGTGNFTKVGTGTMTLGGTNTYAGTTNIDGGKLQLTTPSPFTNLLAEYQFDDPNNLGRDTSGNGNNATLAGNATSLIASGASPALALSTNGVLNLPNLASSYTNAGTLSMWVKLNQAVPTAGANTGFANLSSVSAPNSHYTWVDGNIYSTTFRNNRVDLITPSPLVDRTQWHLVTIVSDPTDAVGGWRMYQNGILIRSAAPSFGIGGFQIARLASVVFKSVRPRESS
jgi:autotransporter-associated beta strand protein